MEKHKNDDYNWRHCADHHHPHHPLRNERHLNLRLKQSSCRMTDLIPPDHLISFPPPRSEIFINFKHDFVTFLI